MWQVTNGKNTLASALYTSEVTFYTQVNFFIRLFTKETWGCTRHNWLFVDYFELCNTCNVIILGTSGPLLVYLQRRHVHTRVILGTLGSSISTNSRELLQTRVRKRFGARRCSTFSTLFFIVIRVNAQHQLLELE